ncbi:MAG: light-harvesting protein [Roseobacter sp.]|jgi:light-harvesting protein B-800-850 alpha chain|nr:light-harvesting protein [Roseobacter sp.]
MNNAKMWLVVKPTVGVPLFLSAVAVGSFAVHVAVLSNTSWVSDFLSGKELGSGDEMATAALLDSPDAANASYTTDKMDGTREVTIILSDGTPVKAILQPSEVHATSATAETYSVVTQ